MYTESHNRSKVIVPREEVAEYVDAHPNCGLRRTRAYWFEFDEAGEVTDSDVPAQDSGEGECELSVMAWQWLQDNGPLLRDGVERCPATHYQHLDAGHDTNGNPRRVFVLYDAKGDIVRAIDEGYRGTPKECRDLIQLPGYEVPARTRRELLKTHA